MAGTTIGGKKAAQKNLAKDPDFYKKIALLGQIAWDRNGRKPRGFKANPELARIAGKKGGSISRRNGPPVYENIGVATDERVGRKRRFALFGR